MKALLRQGFLLMLTLSAHAAAEAPPADLDALAAAPYWHRLLRDARPDDDQYLSEASRPDFFLAIDGRHQARAELAATLAALAAPTLGDDRHAACRFPARRAWLAEQRPDLAATWPTPVCAALTEWLGLLDASQATLVFASDYLNNPSSLFGHTLLRIDARRQGDDTRLLAYAINYAAQTGTTNGVAFAINGLTGGYPGQFSLLPYYEKVKEYNDWESRDLWEYELSLSPAEVRRLLLAYWEWRGLSAPYYFFSRNCSYALLGLIEMARPGLRLQAGFRVHAIPTDTVRVVAAQGLVKRVTWRASSGTRRDTQAQRNPAAVNAAVSDLLRDGASTMLPALDSVGQAQALETAYDTLYARYLAREVDTSQTPPRLRSLLAARSVLNVPDQRLAPVQPAIDPARGHATSRWGLGAVQDGRGALLASFRPAYHDWLDNPGGYRQGARIDFLAATWRLSPEGRLGLEEASLVAIDSLAPVTRLAQPLSWSVRVGADRVLGDDRSAQRHTVAVVEGGSGLAVAWGNGTCHLQSHADVRGGPGLSQGWEIGAGLRTGCLGSLAGSSRWRWQAEGRPLYRWPAQTMTGEVRLGLQADLTRDQALRLDVRETWRETTLGQVSLQWFRHF